MTPLPTPIPASCATFWKKPACRPSPCPNRGAPSRPSSSWPTTWWIGPWPSIPRPRPAAPFCRQHIEPTGPGDPQPNPPAEPAAVHLADREFTPEQELAGRGRLAGTLAARPSRCQRGRTGPRNERGFELIEPAQAAGHPLRRTAALDQHHPPDGRRPGQPAALPGRPDLGPQAVGRLPGLAPRRPG